MAVVAVSHLTKAYGRRAPALADVSLELGEGVTGLLGPNGAGKSTLLQCVLGLLRDFRGTASVLGLDARRDRLEIRRRVGYMPEADSLLPGMTGVTSVRYLGQLSGLSRRQALRRAHECLHYVGLSDALYRPGEDYSTGMRQRLKLAQALVHDPDVLFLDEPVSGMDPAARDEFLALVSALARDHGKHVVWSSHMLPDVQRVATAVVVLHAGRLLGSLRIEDLARGGDRWRVEAEGPEAAFVDALARHGLALEAGTLESGRDGAEQGRFAATVRVAGPEPLGALLRAAAEAGARVRSAEPLAERLEDVFHRLVGAAHAGTGAS
ncbi:MAG: ABC transporter ATP-binding protein [Planctomycetes bacterium]|nr:ABC transporter ATP-binding protein [Planctomycetota bacterium]